MTFLTKGGLIEKVAPRTYRITDRGRAFLAEHPTEILERDLAKLPGWKEAWRNATKRGEQEVVKPADGITPVEALDNAITALNADLKTRLLATVLEQSAECFERLVLDVSACDGLRRVSGERGRTSWQEW
jgi:restriction system protein